METFDRVKLLMEAKQDFCVKDHKIVHKSGHLDETLNKLINGVLEIVETPRDKFEGELLEHTGAIANALEDIRDILGCVTYEDITTAEGVTYGHIEVRAKR